MKDRHQNGSNGSFRANLCCSLHATDYQKSPFDYATEAVTGSIADEHHGAGEIGSAAAQVLGAAQELSRHSHDLGRKVETFLQGIKAA